MGEQFFKRGYKPIHNLTEDELKEALTLYEEKVSKDIFKEVSNQHGLDFDGYDDVVAVINLFVSKAITKGMEIGNDTSLVIDHYRQVKDIEEDDRCGVEYVIDGSFYPCRLGEHWSTIGIILEEKREDLYEPFIELMHIWKGEKDVYEGVTRDFLDKFIMDNFKLIGEYQSLDSHIKNAKRG